jgi:hypothetical protein
MAAAPGTASTPYHHHYFDEIIAPAKLIRRMNVHSNDGPQKKENF